MRSDLANHVNLGVMKDLTRRDFVLIHLGVRWGRLSVGDTKTAGTSSCKSFMSAN